MIFLGRIETVERFDLGHDRFVEELRIRQGLHKRLGRSLLFVVLIKDHRAILSAAVGALKIEFGRVMCDGEKHVQKLLVRDFGRIEGHLDRLGVAGRAGADVFVVGSLFFAARVSGNYVGYAFDVFIHALDAPKTAAGENGGLGRGGP